MRIQTLSYFAIVSMLFAAAGSSAYAQAHDWDRAHRVIDRTREDLRIIEHRDAWAAADRGHYEAAERNLADIRRDLDQNRLDRGRLEQTINEVEHIMHVDAVNGRARERLGADLGELRHLRDEWHWR